MSQHLNGTPVQSSSGNILAAWGFACLILGVSDFWMENTQSTLLGTLFFAVWAVVPITVLAATIGFLERVLPATSMPNAAGVVISLVGGLGCLGYILHLMTGPSNPDTAGHLGVFMIMPMQLLFVIFLLIGSALVGSVIRIRQGRKLGSDERNTAT